MFDWYKKMGCSAQFLIGMFAFSAVSLTLLKITALLGFDPLANGIGPTKEPFSRKECIQRHQNYYYDRNPDMTELDETKIGIIARRCAVEESEYYGW